jgi:hypothetical protein
MPMPELGDAPIEAAYEHTMREVAAAIDNVLNGGVRPRQTGFVLLVFPFGEQDGRCNYISNGADRRDVVKLLKEQAMRFEAQADREASCTCNNRKGEHRPWCLALK